MNYVEKIAPRFILNSAFLVSMDIVVMTFTETLCSSRVRVHYFFFLMTGNDG